MQEIKLLDSTMNSKNVMLSLLGCLLIYIFAILGGFLISLLFSELHILIIALIADIIATIIVYFFSMIFKNASLYDPYWSVQPIVITFYFFFFYDANPLISIRQIIVLLLVLSWGIRLTGNWIKGWKGINHEDWRYKEFRRQNPKWFWLINFFGIQMMPTLLVYFACLSNYSWQ